jgi:hypothetical protein
MGWVVRVATPHYPEPGKSAEGVRYRRFAHIDILPDWARRIKGKHYVELIDAIRGTTETTWHDSIEDAKLYVEAMFALDN